MKTLANLCLLMEDCDVGCVVLTASYKLHCHVEMNSSPGVFITPMSAEVVNSKPGCKAKMEQTFLIAPFVKCELDELNQVLKLNGELKGPLIEAWEAFYKIKECVACWYEDKLCDRIYLDRVLNPDVCGPHVVLPTIWKTEFFC